MNYSIEHYEPDPNQSKEAMLKNRTYQKFRWKEVFRLNNYALDEAISHFSQFGNNYRLKSLYGEIIVENKTIT